MKVLCIDGDWQHISGPRTSTWPAILQIYTVTRKKVMQGFEVYELAETGFNKWFMSSAFLPLSNIENIKREINEKHDRPPRDLPDPDLKLCTETILSALERLERLCKKAVDRQKEKRYLRRDDYQAFKADYCIF